MAALKYTFPSVPVKYTTKISVISPNLLVWKFCGKAQFPIVSGDSPETMRKLCLSAKVPYQEIR